MHWDTVIALVAGSVIAGFSLLTAGAAVGLLDVAPSPSVVGAAAAGNGDYGASDSAVAGAAAYPVPPVVKLAGALHLEEEVAWHEGRTVRYYDLGTHSSLDGDTTAIADVWVFIDGFDNDGAPRFIPGHPALFDVVPGQEGYSDLWDVHFVIVPSGYDSSAIRSLAALQASGLEIVAAEMLVDCPVVPAGSTIEDGCKLRSAWSRGSEVVYFDFGVTSPTPMRVWLPITGFDAVGRPLFVPGQQPVIEAAPGEPGYSHFQRVYYVTVDPPYEANSIRSVEDVSSSGYGVTPTRILLNRPVVDSS